MTFDDGSTCESPASPRMDPWRCPQCSGEMRVVDSRPRDGYIHRRRRCLSCAFAFNTHEVVTTETERP